MKSEPHLPSVLARIAEGDMAALSVLIEATQKQLIGFCKHTLHDEHRAQEVVQDVFVAVWLAADSYDAMRGTALTWLYGIASNRCVDNLRKKRLDECSLEHADKVADLSNPEDDLAALQLRSLLTKEVDRLPSKYRTALMLRFFQDMSNSAAALELGVPVGTIKTRVARGLRRVRMAADGALTVLL